MNFWDTPEGKLEFLKEYNPLLNLKWNDKDKIRSHYTSVITTAIGK